MQYAGRRLPLPQKPGQGGHDYNEPVSEPIRVELSAVVLTVAEDEPRVLVLAGGEHARLPSDQLRSTRDQTLEFAARRLLRRQVGLEPAWLEQLYTFGDRRRNFWPRSPDRTITVAYLALVRHGHRSLRGHWRACYEFFPWEDQRSNPESAAHLGVALAAWRNRARADATRSQRSGRIEHCLGQGQAGWTPDLVLERYELIYEAALVAETWHDRGVSAPKGRTLQGACMSLDHRRILATALGRMRGKLRYRPVVFELMPREFTLFELQRVIESIIGRRLHKQNFRRLVANQRLVEPTGVRKADTGGRPARLYRFRPEAQAERRSAGVLS